MRVTVIATGFEKRPEDAIRRVEKAKANDRFGVPAQKAMPANAASAKPVADEKPRAAQPKPPRPRDDDDFGGLFDMMLSTKK